MKLKSFKMNRMFFFVVLVLGGLFLAYFMLMSAKEGFDPGGNWRDTCSDNPIIDTTLNTITVKCQKPGSPPRKNIKFNYGSCPNNYSVENINGRLTCGP